jgi:two-component system phosphate regulon sensor histidine kinase PhoR
MKKRSISLIIGLMGFALIGVITMQLYFLWQSYHMQSELFDRSVNEALNNVVIKIEKQDALNFLQTKVKNQSQDSVKQKKQPPQKAAFKSTEERKKQIARIEDSLLLLKRQRQIDEQRQAALSPPNTIHVSHFEQFEDEFGQVHQNFQQKIITVDENGSAWQSRKSRKINQYDTLRYLQLDPIYGLQLVSTPVLNPLWIKEQQRIKKEKQFQQIKSLLNAEKNNLTSGDTVVKQPNIIENLADEYQKASAPLGKRINPLWIDTLLRIELQNKGISLPFSYTVSTSDQDSLIFSKALDVAGEIPQFDSLNTYQTTIFNKELISDPGKIKITFPEKNHLILARMTASMATSGGLIAILILCFSYTISSILKQKKISEMKNDFINNMTHEFKTPVSTIMIASEALKDAEIVNDENRVTKLANIIYDENLRLGSHIERVLNIARIEREDFKLDISTIDVNELIVNVIDSIGLKLQKHNATVDFNLEAKNALIQADELHFSNVIYNLIDNAIKYSKDFPKIQITTTNKNKQLLITVKDNGIGMTRDQQTRIFEQFYRIPTGNLHDVKGFGLGLSYVNTIVKRLDGSVSVRSEKDNGSEFELKFPVVES